MSNRQLDDFLENRTQAAAPAGIIMTRIAAAAQPVVDSAGKD